LEQQNAIEDAIDALAEKDKDFRNTLLLEQNRKENGEDISLFVKNLENVQGDERDIIIFSTGYAKNEFGKVVAHFGLLSNQGGENRLNVAITRAKQKIYLVTSIEPEELNVEGSKNIGPKLFKEYLKYVRAVANGNVLETKIILNNLLPSIENSNVNLNGDMENQIKSELEALGYTVETNVGNTAHNIPLAIYDKKQDKYLLGIECDYTAYESSDSILERDVYKPEFLKSRGWKIFRIWSRDWWMNKKKVLNAIVKCLNK
jgi:translation initiation factor 1 (eIF-1/SUI1)